MGKPFAKELEKINDTLTWALAQDTSAFRKHLLQNKSKPLFVVGSGGSLSACHYAALLYQQCGIMAKAITPLELYYSQNTLRESNVLFITASGKNTDILFGYKTAISFEPNKIFSLCMKLRSPLAALAAETSLSEHFEYDNPAGKDGFLATNSLIAFFAILFNTLCINPKDEQGPLEEDITFLADLEDFICKITPDYTFNLLHAGYGQPVAVDLESKLAEAALADVLVSDYRNFGHGRHHWFDKRKDNSAIIAIISPEEELLAKKTLEILPADIPVLIIRTGLKGSFGSIDLLVKSFSFIRRVGEIQKIDPGRPGVPGFGSKLYNLRYSNLFKPEKSGLSELERIAILRKTKVPSINSLSEQEVAYWSKAYRGFKKTMNSATFGAIIFDYDGTLCAGSNRFCGIDAEVTTSLNELLENGLVIGIATGRGQSVRKDLVDKIPTQYHDRVIIGYYNCADIGFLSDVTKPDKEIEVSKPLQELFATINAYDFPVEISPELKPNQITVEIKKENEWKKVRTMIIDLILSQNLSGIQILESSHSMDIIDQNMTSKLNVISHCESLIHQLKLAGACLCIGDKGQWPGNDYQLLTSTYSLSVDEVSSLSETGWNVAAPGIKNVKATIYYLSCLTYKPNGVTINLL
ncbi:hypothetical protein [Mucilaginibacter sp.]|uniref:hypothetical protein n=1 Tax=Mucilaginibacter sp. TaxID=1882438 RepID=UPI003B00B986